MNLVSMLRTPFVFAVIAAVLMLPQVPLFASTGETERAGADTSVVAAEGDCCAGDQSESEEQEHCPDTPAERCPQPCEPCDGPCDCPCCHTHVRPAPMFVAAMSSMPPPVQPGVVQFFPATLPESVSLSVQIQPPIV